MVYFVNEQQVIEAYSGSVGQVDYADIVHAPDSSTAISLSDLKYGQSVLELGPAGGRLITAAKLAVGDGFCAAVDVVQGFIDKDIPWKLRREGLEVAPNGTSENQVHLLRLDVTDPAMHPRLLALHPDGFDRIFALHIVNTIPADKRLHFLQELRRLLKPTGCLIVSLSARFAGVPTSPAEEGLPAQFKTTPMTECPGSILTIQYLDTQVSTPNGSRCDKVVIGAIQFAPDRLWTTAAQQAREAAEHAGFQIYRIRPIGDGKDFDLPVVWNPPSLSHLDQMAVPDISNMLLGVPINGRAQFGQALEITAKKGFPDFSSLTQEEQSFVLVDALQRKAMNVVSQMRAARPAPGVRERAAEHVQVAVLAVLTKP
ncbi:Methyltransf-26 domain containing protein [Pyrenophora tritici-repentis]|nr:Methyltransf-26 domain containing protein [Pyrenophora tritici-repentis]